MKSKYPYILVVVSVVIIILGLQYKIAQKGTQNVLGESQAIEYIKNMYPDLKEYPSDNLPPKSMVVEKDADGMYVAFIQNGSGRPIISARCFYITKDMALPERRFVAEPSDMNMDFSAKDCTSKKR